MCNSADGNMYLASKWSFYGKKKHLKESINAIKSKHFEFD